MKRKEWRAVLTDERPNGFRSCSLLSPFSSRLVRAFYFLVYMVIPHREHGFAWNFRAAFMGSYSRVFKLPVRDNVPSLDVSVVAR